MNKSGSVDYRYRLSQLYFVDKGKGDTYRNLNSTWIVKMFAT